MSSMTDTERQLSLTGSGMTGGNQSEPKLTSKMRLTLCVVGSGGVGKSSLTMRYLQGHFTEYYDPTIEESFVTTIEYGFDQHDVEIVDTAGQEEFMLCRDSSLAKGDAFLALFAINSPESWEDVKRLREKIVRINEGDERIPILFIASKSDLTTEDSRKVNLDEVLEYCESCDCPLLETSAKTGLNVVESFRLLLDRVSLLQPIKFKDSILTEPEVITRPDKKNKCIIS